MIRCISSTETLDWKPSTGLSPVSGLTTSLPPRTLQNSRPVAMIKQPHTLAGTMFWQTSIFGMSLKINRVSTWFFHTIQGIIYLDLGPRESPGPWAAEARTWNKPSWRPRRPIFDPKMDTSRRSWKLDQGDSEYIRIIPSWRPVRLVKIKQIQMMISECSVRIPGYMWLQATNNQMLLPSSHCPLKHPKLLRNLDRRWWLTKRAQDLLSWNWVT